MGTYEKTRYPGIFKYKGRHGEKYGIDYYSGGKKIREIIGPLLSEAQEKLAEKRAMAGNGSPVVNRKKITFDQLAEKYEEIQKGEPYFEKTRKYYVEILKGNFKGRRLYQITPLDVETFKKQRKDTPTRAKKERSEVAVNRELETLRHVFNKGVEWGMMEKNPFDKFREPIFFKEDENRVRYLTEDEINRLMAVLDAKAKEIENPNKQTTEDAQKKVNPYYLKNIVMAALLTGLRRGDILNLKWPDVDMEKGILFFNEQKKKNKRRVKVLNSDMIQLLKSIPKGESQYIFNGPDGKPLRDIKRSFRTALKRAGIKNFHFHDLRHTSASYMVMRGASLKSVQEHLGHTSLTMTQRYAHLSPEFQRSEVERLSGVFSLGLPDSKNLVRSEPKPEFPNEAGAYANA
jgi:integrase